jgi:uncharacterized protein YdiU (UPF0061 family)
MVGCVKLGLLQKEEEGDEQLVKSFFDAMHESGADFTNSFRGLARVALPSPSETIAEKDEAEDEALAYLLQQGISPPKSFSKPCVVCAMVRGRC